MVEYFNVTAEPVDSGWLLQCVEHPGAMSQVEDLTDPFVIREAIAFVAGRAEDTFSIDFKAKTDLLDLQVLQTSDQNRAHYIVHVLPNRLRLGRKAMAEWVLGVLRTNCPDPLPEQGILGVLSSDWVDPESVMGAYVHLYFDSGRTLSFPKVGNKKISDILSVVPDATALTAWLLDQRPNYYSSSAYSGRFSSVQLGISSYRTRNAPVPVQKQESTQTLHSPWEKGGRRGHKSTD